MKKYFETIKNTKLFEGIEPSELEALLGCLGAQIKKYRKDEWLLMAGETPEYVGILLEGNLHILREDIDGSRTIIAAVGKGEMFAEALCCAKIKESPVSVTAESNCAVMLLRFSRILTSCTSACGFHTRLIGNMMGILAQKNLYLQSRMETVALKSLREKLMRYFKPFIAKQGREFEIPLNRQELADYLNADRSALSHELMKMKSEGILEYKRNRFKF